MKEIWIKIKDSIYELATTSTWHGLPSAFRTRRLFFKIMWVILFLGAAGYGCFLISKTVIDYLSFDYVTKIDIIQEDPTQFPTVLFCNLREKLESKYNLNETIIQCNFGANSCSFETDFTWYYDIRYGYCFVFNQGIKGNSYSIKKSSLAGYYNGLHLILFTGPLNPFDNGPESSGFHIYVTNYSIPNDPNLGVDVSTGFQTRLSIFRDFSEKLGKPYNDCENNLNSFDDYDSDIYKEMFRYNISYTQKYCFNILAFKQVGIECNCSAPINIIQESCSKKLISNSLCIQNTYNNYFAEYSYNKMANECPLECSTIKYRLVPSSADLDYGQVRAALDRSDLIKKQYNQNNLTYEVLKKTTLEIAIYYEELSYTMITQTPKLEAIDLVSNIGGLLGLFIGTSFLSFVELIEIALEVVFILFETKSTKITQNNN